MDRLIGDETPECHFSRWLSAAAFIWYEVRKGCVCVASNLCLVRLINWEEMFCVGQILKTLSVLTQHFSHLLSRIWWFILQKLKDLSHSWIWHDFFLLRLSGIQILAGGIFRQTFSKEKGCFWLVAYSRQAQKASHAWYVSPFLLCSCWSALKSVFVCSLFRDFSFLKNLYHVLSIAVCNGILFPGDNLTVNLR